MEVFNARGFTNNATLVLGHVVCSVRSRYFISIRVWSIVSLFLHGSFHNPLFDKRMDSTLLLLLNALESDNNKILLWTGLSGPLQKTKQSCFTSGMRTGLKDTISDISIKSYTPHLIPLRPNLITTTSWPFLTKQPITHSLLLFNRLRLHLMISCMTLRQSEKNHQCSCKIHGFTFQYKNKGHLTILKFKYNEKDYFYHHVGMHRM